MKLYEFIRNESDHYGVERMCRVFEISRSSYYKWLKSSPGFRRTNREKLKTEICRLFEESKKTYGSPRISEQLKKNGFSCSRSLTARIMRGDGLRSIIRKKFRITTQSNHKLPICDNLLARNFYPSGLSEVWVSDITYIWTNEGWLYLTSVIDLADRQIIGWALSSGMKVEETSAPALMMALKRRAPKPGLKFHSDRGVQYAAAEFSKLISKAEIVQSMSRKGNCWDNAVAESFFKTLKSEMTNHHKFETRCQAENALFDYIEIFYNRKRIHSTLNFMTPFEVEQKLLHQVA